MNESESHEKAPLQCIGSFRAYTDDGQTHTIEVWTRFQQVHNREHKQIEPGLLVLTTTDGFGVRRIEQGEYCLEDQPEVRLTTTDPHAP